MYSLPLLNRSTGMEGDRSFSSASNNSANTEDHEYVWDGFTHGEQLATTPNDDYYEDLELAARLGKTLLQKNKELDTLNYQLRCCNEEQNLEIEHLNKQMTWLREVNESKTLMFEQLDVNYQELESSNRKLKAESREWKERVTKCMSVCESQEDQIQSCKSEIETVRKLHEGKKSREKMRRRTIHGCLPTFQQDELDIQRFLETSTDFSKSLSQKEEKNSKSQPDVEVAALHEVIGNLRAQQIMDKRMVKELRKEFESVVQENQESCEKLQEEREMTQRLSRIIEEYDKVVYRQAFVAESTPNITAELTNNDLNFTDQSDDDEDESMEQPSRVNPHFENESKTSFQSPALRQVLTPMSKYLRIANSTPMKSLTLSQNDLCSGHDPSLSHITKSNATTLNISISKCQRDSMKSEPKNVSLVQELDTQYKNLLGKYEMLLHSIESERVASPVDARSGMMRSIGNDTSSFLIDSSLASEADTSVSIPNCSNISRPGSTDGIPEYKRLFREIFNMINEAKA